MDSMWSAHQAVVWCSSFDKFTFRSFRSGYGLVEDILQCLTRPVESAYFVDARVTASVIRVNLILSADF